MMDKNEFYKMLKVDIPLKPTREDIDAEEKKRKQIEMIYESQIKKGNKCDKAKAISIIKKNSNGEDALLVSEVELKILNNIAEKYEFENNEYSIYKRLFTQKPYIDKNIYKIIKQIEQKVYEDMEKTKLKMPKYYNMKLNEFGKKNLVLGFVDNNNIYKSIEEMINIDNDRTN